MSRGRAADESVGVGVDTQSRPPSIATTRPSSLHPPIAATRPSTMAHQNERRGWELDESAFRSELQLIDDSYYRVYDDESYDVWRERIMSLVELQVKAPEPITVPTESTEGSAATWLAPNDINPVRPMLLELPATTIYAGLETPPSIENYQLNVAWGVKYLLGEVDQCVEDKTRRTQLKAMIMETRQGRSKWSNPSRQGQEELYNGLDKVLLDLKAYTPHCIPFLVKVNKKDVPDYYTVIKRPMDLGTMGKKLKGQEYANKQQFLDDLQLIYSNCFTYNTAEDSIYRQHVQMLRDKWTYLMKTVPDVVIGRSVPLEEASITSATRHQPPFRSETPSSTHPRLKESTPSGLDDLDSLLNTHLEGLSDLDSEPSPKKTRRGRSPPRPTPTLQSAPLVPSGTREFILPKGHLPPRHCRLMQKYIQDFEVAKEALERDDHESTAKPTFIFPELLYFFNTIPDSHLITAAPRPLPPVAYSSKPAMTRAYGNFRICQAIRERRKCLLEGARTEAPTSEGLHGQTNRFESVEVDRICGGAQARTVLRKIVALYLAQLGFELLANSALNAMCELVESFAGNLSLTLRMLFEEYHASKEPAEIVRLALFQNNVRSLLDLETHMHEEERTRERFTQLLAIIDQEIDTAHSMVQEAEAPGESSGESSDGPDREGAASDGEADLDGDELDDDMGGMEDVKPSANEPKTTFDESDDERLQSDTDQDGPLDAAFENDLSSTPLPSAKAPFRSGSPRPKA